MLLHVGVEEGRRRATLLLLVGRARIAWHRHARNPVGRTRLASEALGPRARCDRRATCPRGLDNSGGWTLRAVRRRLAGVGGGGW